MSASPNQERLGAFREQRTIPATMCFDGQFLPARTTFIEHALDYPFRPDARRVFLEQAATVPLHLAETVVLPEFSRINQRLADQLDLAYTSGQMPDVTAANISAAVKTIMAS
jgi:multiple sugar transport system substrate-binding protein